MSKATLDKSISEILSDPEGKRLWHCEYINNLLIFVSGVFYIYFF